MAMLRLHDDDYESHPYSSSSSAAAATATAEEKFKMRQRGLPTELDRRKLFVGGLPTDGE